MEQNEYNRPKEETSLPEKRKSDRRFLKGAVIGAAVVLIAVLCVCGGGTLIRHLITGGSYASGSVSESDVNEKLDVINALIDRYYLYEDEIDAEKDRLQDEVRKRLDGQCRIEHIMTLAFTIV